MMTKKRLKEILDSIWASHGWKSCETAEERAEIVAFWNTLPGHTTFYDAVDGMFRRAGEEDGR